MDTAYVAEKIAVLKARIDETEQAMSSLIAGEIEMYKLDTGQSSQTVTKLNISVLRSLWEKDLSLLSTLQSRSSGSGTFNVAPGW